MKRIIIYWHIFHSSGFHHICNIKCRLDCRYSPQNIFNAKNFDPHKKPISLLNVPICTQGMQRTWWPEAGTIIVTGPYYPVSIDLLASLIPQDLPSSSIQPTFPHYPCTLFFAASVHIVTSYLMIKTYYSMSLHCNTAVIVFKLLIIVEWKKHRADISSSHRC